MALKGGSAFCLNIMLPYGRQTSTLPFSPLPSVLFLPVLSLWSSSLVASLPWQPPWSLQYWLPLPTYSSLFPLLFLSAALSLRSPVFAHLVIIYVCAD